MHAVVDASGQPMTQGRKWLHGLYLNEQCAYHFLQQSSGHLLPHSYMHLPEIKIVARSEVSAWRASVIQSATKV